MCFLFKYVTKISNAINVEEDTSKKRYIFNGIKENAVRVKMNEFSR